MANFYNDNEDILFHMNHIDLDRIIELKEDGFKEKDAYPYAPKNKEDAIENYKKVLEVVGDITGNFIAPRAADVDREGATFKDGEVYFAKGTAEALQRLKEADLTGFTIPREYGGINFPKTIYSAAIEMVSRADASMMNLFGLQEIADTIFKFGSKEQKERILPKFCSGEVMGSMALTEPDAGSDLQAVMLKATEIENGKWKLNGVKRFITNGLAQVSLVMARSEEGTKDGRGISLFVYERDEHMKIRRIEHKLGIHGSPTCELQFNDAPAELLGKRKLGLIKYTMSLMNGARLGVSAQAIGIAEAAYREAKKYAKERSQFKKPIMEFTAISEMLVDMKTSIEAARAMLYETSRMVDIKEGIEERIEKYPELTNDLSNDLKKYTKLAGFYTPLLKSYATEMTNKVCYDAIQIHGGVGFTTEFNVERHYRDARITNIYEGTTQLQVIAAIGGVTSGLILEAFSDYENDIDFTTVADLFEQVKRFRTNIEVAIGHVKEKNDKLFTEYHSARLVRMSSDTMNCYLLCKDAIKSERKKAVAKAYIAKAKGRIENELNYILNSANEILDLHSVII